MTASIRLTNVSVQYPIYDASHRSIKNALLQSVGGRLAGLQGHAAVRALSGVNLTLAPGDRLALVGHNGAGKSTLLKVLARIYEPTEGEAVIEGGIASLIDIMMGMDPDATGYENILLRGTITGQDPAVVRATIPEVEAFTELGSYLSMPIRIYSTGMLVRLAFAVSTTVRPDILIMDEMVGAADAAFTQKAQKRISDYIAASKIVILASHDPSMLRMFCNRAVMLEKGQIVLDDSVDAVLKRYAERGAGG